MDELGVWTPEEDIVCKLVGVCKLDAVESKEGVP